MLVGYPSTAGLPKNEVLPWRTPIPPAVYCHELGSLTFLQIGCHGSKLCGNFWFPDLPDRRRAQVSEGLDGHLCLSRSVVVASSSAWSYWAEKGGHDGPGVQRFYDGLILMS